MKLSNYEHWNKLQKLVVGGFIAIIVSLFLPWAKVSFMGMSVTGRGLDVDGVFLPILVLAYPVLTAITDIKNIHKFAGVVFALFSFFFAIVKFSDLAGGSSREMARMIGMRSSIGFGLIIYLLGVTAVGLGHFLLNRDDRDRSTNDSFQM